jgi:hypothetical protein
LAQTEPGDPAWQRVECVFRVCFFSGDLSGDGPFAVETTDVSDATFLETLAWAEQNVGGSRSFAIALVSADADGVAGLTWLVGTDANRQPHDSVERRLYNELGVQRPAFGHRGRRARP